MDKNKVAAALLILFSLLFILLILFIEKVPSVALYASAFLIISIAALMMYLYWPRLSGQKKRWLILFFIIPAIVVLLMNLMKY